MAFTHDFHTNKPIYVWHNDRSGIFKNQIEIIS